MAQLDVRERRMETTIAYVGASLAGKATNLHHLKSDSAHGRSTDLHVSEDTLSLEWHPRRADRFDDCDVAVKLVATKGTPSTARLDEVLGSADGVVVVVDASPSARDERARVLSLVQNALSKVSARKIPVVVQANKVDLADAEAVQELAGEVDWPIVPASAMRGEGVIETLEMALSKVLEAMKTKPAASPTGTPKIDQNPLLSALREILRETVSEHMAELEAQARARITASVTETVERSEKLLSELRTMMLMNAKETARALALQEEALDSLAASVADMRGASSDLTARVERLTAKHDKLQEDLAARSRADREHATALASSVKRHVQAVEVDLKRLDPRDQHAQFVAEVAGLHSKVEALATTIAPAAASIVGFPARLGALESSLQREVRDRLLAQLTRLEGSLQVLHVDTGDSLQRADARASEIQGGLNELLDELKKRKKGWFS